jgi:hypothetical protein
MGGEVRGAKATYKCKCCRTPFVARVADRDRGWARFCSKSCKANHQMAGGPRNQGRYVHEYGTEPAGRDYFRDDDTHPFSDDAVQGAG